MATHISFQPDRALPLSDRAREAAGRAQPLKALWEALGSVASALAQPGPPLSPVAKAYHYSFRSLPVPR